MIKGEHRSPFLYLYPVKVVFQSFLLFFLLTYAVCANAQYTIVSTSQDTLTYENRVLTHKLDSVALVQSGYLTLQPGGNFNSLGGIYQNDFLNGFSLFRQHVPRFSNLKQAYAGLPHLGFYYAFGARGLQNIHLDFQQTIAKKFGINLAFDGMMLNDNAGFLRNNSYRNSVVRLLMNYQGERYEGLYYMNYYFGNRKSSNGVATDSLLNEFPMQLIPVKNQSAFAKFNNVEAGTQHLIPFTKDSLVKHGFVYQNELKVQNRKYTELQADILNYDTIYKDSASTYDHYQWQRMRNEGGYYLKSQRLKIAAKAFHQYWKYKNQGINLDTTEVGVNANLLFTWSKFELKSDFEFTFLGAIGEMYSKSQLRWNDEKFNIVAHLNFENNYPSVFMRKYSGNNVQWYVSNPQLQQTIKIGGKFDWKFKIPFQISGEWANLSNTYWLIDNQLRNDTLKNVSLTNISISTRLNAGNFHFDPYIALNLTSQNIRFVPLLDSRLNIYWNKKLFSTKKFDFILGATARFQTKYDMISYNNLVDLYQFSNATSPAHQPIVRVDIYTGFQIDNFRFFVRYENLDYFWNNRQNFTIQNYPIAPGAIRIGLTWDFFN